MTAITSTSDDAGPPTLSTTLDKSTSTSLDATAISNISSLSDDIDVFDAPMVVPEHSKREYLLAQIRQKDAIIESLLKQVSPQFFSSLFFDPRCCEMAGLEVSGFSCFYRSGGAS